MFYGLGIFCMFASILNFIWHVLNVKDHGYMFLIQMSFFKSFLIRFFNWVIIFGNVVPISLMVSLEGVKFIQGVIIARDKELASKGIHCEVQSSNLNEELGNIKYVFSDKTGTLTKNKMIFRKLLIQNIPYGDDDVHHDMSDEESDDENSVLFKGRNN